MPEGKVKPHFRGKMRRGRRVVVHYAVIADGAGGPTIRAYTRNIGVGGAFIETEDPQPAGTKLRVTLTLNGGVTIDVESEVRWMVDGELEPVHGMGVKFLGLGSEDQRRINDYCASLPQSGDLDDMMV